MSTQAAEPVEITLFNSIVYTVVTLKFGVRKVMEGACGQARPDPGLFLQSQGSDPCWSLCLTLVRQPDCPLPYLGLGDRVDSIWESRP